jgi:hypothetical protein
MRVFSAVQGELLYLLCLHLLLTALPMAAAALGAAKLGERRLPVLLAVALAAGGLVATLAWWIYYGNRTAGESFSYFVILASVAWIAWCLFVENLDRELLRGLLTPFALWGLGSVFLVFFGFLHGGIEQPLGTGATRFIGPLPSDNDIPKFFAEWFYENGHHGDAPMFPGEWLSSDRPPLQVGYVMSQRPFGWDTTSLHYQVLGVVLQQLWIVGTWALLLAARVGQVTRALAIVTLLVSSLTLLNGFFVWPKLLPAAMLLAAAAMVLTPLWDELRGRLWAGALFAALCGIAMLGHGSSVFGIVPLLAVAAVRGLPSWRWIGVAALVGFVLMAPWSAYQKWGDPPGNRLVKWTLAGVMEIDERGTTEAVVDVYGEAGLGRALYWKGQNFATMAGGSTAYESLENAFDSGGAKEIVLAIRNVFFFNLLPSLGLLLLGPIAMALAWRRGRRDSQDWRFALACLGAFLIGCIAWALLVIGNENDRTVIHIGTYLIPILGICGCVAALRASLPRFAVPYLVVAAALSLALYVPALQPPPGTSYSVLNALLAAAALAGFAALASRPGSRA